MTFEPWVHQRQTHKLYCRSNAVFDTSDAGCVSGDTEYLTPTGWKRIDQYTKGDKVAQFWPETREVEFIEPLDYIVRPCRSMLHIMPSRGTNQKLSLEHRVLYYLSDGSYDECSAEQYYRHLCAIGPNHTTQRKFCATYSVKGPNGIKATDEELRIMVAVIADGHFSSPSTRCTVRLKKDRKQRRLRKLLQTAGVPFIERTCGGQTDFQVFRFDAPWREKHFSSRWWSATQEQLELIADEVQHWDSSVDLRSSGGCRFSTSVLESAEFIQYAMGAAKRPSSIKKRERHRRGKAETEYCVHSRKEDALVGPGRLSAVSIQPTEDGKKYCFTTPSTYLLLRCNGYVFATGNTGKTAVALLAFAERRRKGGGRALIIAPKTLLEAAWTEEIDKYFPHLRYSVAYASNREKAFSVKADVYITNTDAVKWLKTQPKRFFSTFDTLIIDESSAFKHHASQRSKAIKKLAPLFKYRSLLTATPFSKSVTEMWHQILLLDDGAHFGRSYTKFRDAVCEPYYEEGQNTHPKWRDRPGAYATIVQMISDICIRHEFHDVMKNVPHGTEHKVFFKLPPKLRSAYEELKESLILKLESGEVTALNAAILRGKLLQVASGSVYGSSGAATIDDGRTELVCDLVEQRKHSVVFYNWDHQREALVNAFTKRGIVFAEISSKHKGSVRNETVQKYQAGEFQTLLMHPQTGAHGLTLTRGTATIWCSPTDRPGLLIQGKHRVLRGGQTEVTENVMVCARGTIEEGVYQKTDRERDAIAELLSLIKESR